MQTPTEPRVPSPAPAFLRLPVKRHARGFSLVELVVVIGIIGIIGALAVSGFTGSTEAAMKATAQDTVAKLNAAVRLFSQTNWTISTAANDAATTDEAKVLKTLQWSDNFNAAVFTPYYQPLMGSDTKFYRLRWNGVSYVTVPPGTVGQGILIDQVKGNMTGTKVDLTGFTPDPAAVN